MKSLGSSLKEVLQNCPSEVFKEKIKEWFKGLQPYYTLEEQETLGDNLQENFGGLIYLIEEEADLKNIATLAYKNDNYLSILETAESFDICEKLDDNYVHVLLITNNSGGNSYLIPPEIANHPNILKSIELSKN